MENRKMAGLGSGVVLLWLYNDLLAPAFGLAPLPADVAAVMAAALVEWVGLRGVGSQPPSSASSGSAPDPAGP